MLAAAAVEDAKSTSTTLLLCSSAGKVVVNTRSDYFFGLQAGVGGRRLADG